LPRRVGITGAEQPVLNKDGAPKIDKATGKPETRGLCVMALRFGTPEQWTQDYVNTFLATLTALEHAKRLLEEKMKRFPAEKRAGCVWEAYGSTGRWELVRW
jgi:hypothetical protein